MAIFEEKLNQKQVVVENTSGADYAEGALVFEQGWFGNVVEVGGIADGETGLIDINIDREIQTDQIVTSDTLTWANSGTNLVYYILASGLLSDTDPGTSTAVTVGVLLQDGSKDANNVIVIKPLQSGGLVANA